MSELDDLYELFAFIDTITEDTEVNKNDLSIISDNLRKQFNFNLKIE